MGMFSTGKAIDTRVPVLEFNARYSRFEWYGSYHHNTAPRLAGFYWSPEHRCWITPSYEKAKKLIAYADEQTRERLLHPPQLSLKQ